MKTEEQNNFISHLVKDKKLSYLEYDEKESRLKVKSTFHYNSHMFFKEMIDFTTVLTSNGIIFKVESDNSIQIL